MDELKTLQELLSLMHEHDLDALRVRVGERTFELVRRDSTTSPQPEAQATVAAQKPELPASAAPSAPDNAKRVTAPVVGVFYRSAAPGAEVFVNVGDRVAVGQVLCILEAMKLMNEITSDYAGVVTRIIPENGELVSLGEEMFWIEP
ncbi:MAG: acetyl-CoA carboxylase biotin carboxyl carrier protein [Candidatus Eremiobacteraeota bacterium]|nr:acetyl-CoA carboxylase biotin carboxyl carrier protein [Candidatus Eremiobacteraeota bacterium]